MNNNNKGYIVVHRILVFHFSKRVRSFLLPKMKTNIDIREFIHLLEGSYCHSFLGITLFFIIITLFLILYLIP